MCMSINIEDKLNLDLEFFKVNMSIDVQFIMYLESLKIENLKVVTYDSYYETIIKENREKIQYIALHKERSTIKKIFWFIPWMVYNTDHYTIIGELQWNKKSDTSLTIKIWGEQSYHLLKAPIKNWAQDNEYFVELNVLNAQNNCYYIKDRWKKRPWHKAYTHIKTER